MFLWLIKPFFAFGTLRMALLATEYAALFLGYFCIQYKTRAERRVF